MQLPPVAASLMVRMDEERPHVSIGCIRNRESDDFALNLDNPATAKLFKMVTIVAWVTIEKTSRFSCTESRTRCIAAISAMVAWQSTAGVRMPPR